MSPSYRQINYALRPAKTVERKQICDLFRRLDPFGGIQSYQYIGFGSIYFADFQLFHQALGISDMVSIEREVNHEHRFHFNKPYGCINLKMGDSNEVLPTLDWKKPCAIWLDYDGKLDKSVLADVATIVAKAQSGTVFIVTLNAEPERKPGVTPKEQDEYRWKCFMENIGDVNAPVGLTMADLRARSIEKVYLRVIRSEVLNGLADRNGALTSNKRIQFQQLINLSYSDDAQMMTIGIILYEDADHSKINKCGFGELHFYRDKDDPYIIKVPKLTPKEIRHVNELLPKASTVSLQLPGVPISDLEDYAKIYRYYPSFVESLFG